MRGFFLIMGQRKISVNKTARYFIQGEISDEIEQVWFVLHGYAQLANYFLKKFEILADRKTLVIAPEGLHRFYWEGVGGRVVASWMTKEDREDDIHDYVNYLDAVYSEVISELKNKSIKINILGFSQGSATACRWLSFGKSHADNLVIWEGEFPKDLDLKMHKKIFDDLKICMVMADKDPFISEERVQEQIRSIEESEIKFDLVRFSGGHEINPETLKQIAQQL
jgi:predicted esterase